MTELYFSKAKKQYYLLRPANCDQCSLEDQIYFVVDSLSYSEATSFDNQRTTYCSSCIRKAKHYGECKRLYAATPIMLSSLPKDSTRVFFVQSPLVVRSFDDTFSAASSVDGARVVHKNSSEYSSHELYVSWDGVGVGVDPSLIPGSSLESFNDLLLGERVLPERLILKEVIL